ncbi:unnamed protein product [Effrenium voratum]|nr:unnamed protein product [Effrenium voratum]
MVCLAQALQFLSGGFCLTPLNPGEWSPRSTLGRRAAHYWHPDPFKWEGATLLDGQMRYGEHVDSFGLTILNLDPANPEGLQVQIGEEWVDVPWVKGSFVLNVGALLSRWTNGYWKAAVHRVLFKRGQRLSIVSGALRPDDDVMLEPCGPGALAGEKFAPVRAGDFCQERVALHRPSYLQQKQLDAEAAQRLRVRTFVATGSEPGWSELTRANRPTRSNVLAQSGRKT